VSRPTARKAVAALPRLTLFPKIVSPLPFSGRNNHRWYLESARCGRQSLGRLHLTNLPRGKSLSDCHSTSQYDRRLGLFPLEASSKRLFRMPEDVSADQGAAEFQECFVNVSPTIEAYAKTTEVVEPRVSPLNDPTEFAQTIAMFSAAPYDHRFDAAFAQSLTMRIGIVTTIGIDDPGSLKWSAARRGSGQSRRWAAATG
jgi:hypothetical protein